MKRYLLYFLLFALALGSCKKNKTDPFMENPDERLSAKLSEYQSQLMGAEFGWKAYLLTDSESETLIKVATFLFSFKENKVTMSADYIKDEKEQKKESTYRLKTLQRPTLIFDTYSILHKITDPTPSTFKGEAGAGHHADFEYVFLSANADTIKLEGTFYKNKLYLIRLKSATDNATVLSAQGYMNKTLSNLKTYFKRATINGIDCELYMDPLKNFVRFKYLDEAGVRKTVSANYYVVSETSLAFFEPVIVGNKTLTDIKDVSFDASSKIIKATTSYGEPFQIKEAIAPLYYDATVAAKFIANPLHGLFSYSFTGFKVDGVIDGYGVRKIPDFVAIIYYHNIIGQPYGAVRFVIAPNGSLQLGKYGPAIIPRIEEGKVFYKYIGFYGPPPPEIASIIDNIINNFKINEGFYVIQTGERTYVLVSAKDARSWIDFE